MSYLVLARKYRPSTFAEVVGQDHVTRTLANAFASGRVHHAFLFCGPRGCGKTTLARIVGKALNCLDRKGAEPCGKCLACESIQNGSATDYQEMDGASNRGIDAIRELTEAVRYQPAILRKKVYVIDEVHMLTTEAFNALLKTLEEPPPHVTFVLATTEPHKLPNTILSRCQRYDFKLVPASRLALHLSSIFASEKLTIEAPATSLIVRESGGSVRDALSLADQIISYVGNATITESHVAEVLGVADRTLTRTLVRALAQGDAGVALGAVESAIDRGVDEIQLARAIVRYLRDLSVMQVAPDRHELVDAADEERVELAAEAKELERSRVTQMFDRMLRCCDELGKSLQPRLVLDCALIDVATVEPLVPLGDLIARLGEIESRIGKGGARMPARSSGGGGELRSTAKGANPAPARPPASLAPVGAMASNAPAASSSSSSASPTTTATATGAGTTTGTGAAPAAAKKGADLRATTHDRSASVAAVTNTERSAPVMMAPSGPVPKIDGAATGSGPTKIPQGEVEIHAAWNAVIVELDVRRKVMSSGYCEHARVTKWTADEIELGFTPDFHQFGEHLREKDHADAIRDVMRDRFGHTPKVTIRLLEESEGSNARSVQEATREKSHVERGKREAEAREHPMTKQVLQTFGGHIKEIKTDV